MGIRYWAFIVSFCFLSMAYGQTHMLQVFDNGNSPLPDDNIRALAIAPDSTLWIGTENGLSTLKNGNWGTIDTLDGYQIRAIAFDSAGHAWVGTFLSGLWVQTDTAWVNYTSSNSTLPDDYVRTISFCPNGDVWLGTVGGAVHISNNAWTAYRTSNTNWYVEHIASSYCTPANQIWLGGLNTGLMRQQDTSWVIYRHNNSNLPDNTILDIKGKPNGDIVLAMPASGAAVFDGNLGWILYNSISSNNPSNSINRIAIGTDGRTYFTSADKGLVVHEGGLDWFNISATTNPDTAGAFLPTNELVAIVQDHSGVVWASAINNGLLRIEFVDSTINGIDNILLARTTFYPNPTQDYIIIDAPSSNLNITIANLLGQIIYTQITTSLKTKIPLDELPKGIYTVIIQSGNDAISQRLIKY